MEIRILYANANGLQIVKNAVCHKDALASSTLATATL